MSERRETPRLLFWAGGLSLAGALVHGLLTDDHFQEWWGYGLFFSVASVAQAMYGFVIVGTHAMQGQPISTYWPRASRQRFYAAGIAGNALLVLTYVLSRTVGVPFFGPDAGEVEPWDALGLVTKALELSVIALLAVLLSRTRA